MEELKLLRITPLDEEEDEGDKGTHLETEIEEGEEDMDDEDEDDEDNDDEPVTLGFVEKPNDPRWLQRHFFPSKAGGVPAWLDPVNLPMEKAQTCGFCGEPLHFLLQVYAPIAGNESAFHRTLFVFMCPSMSCLLKDQHEQWKRKADNPIRSVKVFRCQLARANSFYPSEPPERNGTAKPSGSGAPLCWWCGTWKGDKVCNGCKKAQYCSERHQVLHWRSGHKTDCQKFNFSSQAPVIGAVIGKAVCSTLWPEYEIISEDESLYDDEPCDDGGSQTSLVAKHHKEDEVSQALLDKIEADGDKKGWASFQQRIAKAPEQVLRYCRDLKSKPIWLASSGKPAKEDIPKCALCSGPLCYEFQILPQLLYYLGVKDDAESLDWGTIVIYACSASCETSAAYKEEFAWVQLDD